MFYSRVDSDNHSHLFQVLNAPIIFGGLIGSMAVGAWFYKRGMRTWRTWVKSPEISKDHGP